MNYRDPQAVDFKSPGQKARVYRQTFNRLAMIHRLIAGSSYPSVPQLARQLCVTERTIKRDIAALRRDLNAPIRYDRERRGFYYTDPGWTMPVQRISEGELLAFFIAENALRLTGHGPEAHLLRKALAKMASMLPEIVSINLSTLGELIRFESAPQVHIDVYLLQELAEYAQAHLTVEFDYFSPHKQETKHRKADVHLLHNFAGDWYAISYDHDAKDFRDFHVGRIKNLKPTNHTFTPKKNFNAEDYLRRGFQMTRGGRLTNVSLCFDKYQAQWIRERQRFHPDEKRQDLPDGGLRLSFRIGENGLEAVARFCLTYAGHCRVEAPKRLREIVIEKLRHALDLHQDAG